ncbi:hypothetical protein ACFQS2_01605 [Brachybacterium sp. GCM10030267]|uniref:hypothetical protein n=1 Tax=Brachybacterium sp. GCM10030267 TaxID=3273381 RepID=UPI00360A22C5
MIFDLDPLELLASALTAVALAVPIAFLLAASVVAAPRRMWSGAGLGLGASLLVGVIIAGAASFVGRGGLIGTLTGVGIVLGMLCALATAVLVVLRRDGSALGAGLGIAACVLIGLSDPSRILPAFFGISSSEVIALAAVVIEAMAVVALASALVALGARVRALQVGTACAAAVAGVLTLAAMIVGGVPGTSRSPLLSVLVIAFAVGSIAGGVLEARHSREADATVEG